MGVSLNFLTEYEFRIVRYLNQTIATAELDALAMALSSWWTWSCTAAICYFWLLAKNKNRAVIVLFIALISLGISDATCAYILKPIFARLRPCKEFLESVRAVAGCASFYGFPSNHACNAMATVAVFYRLGGKAVGLVALLLAFSVGISRAYLGLHYPSDVIAGFAFGAIVGYACVSIRIKWLGPI